MKQAIILVLVVLVVGCASDPPAPPIPPEFQYVPPSASILEVATIQGSQENRTAGNDLTAFVIAVDGKFVMSEQKSWSSALPILPNVRNIAVGFQSDNHNARTDLSLKAKAGQHYQVRSTIDAEGTHCDFWIVDMDTQKPVTEPSRVLVLSGLRLSDVIPIFILTGQ
jgi:hypothetical protein